MKNKKGDNKLRLEFSFVILSVLSGARSGFLFLDL
jgi:hypothetical protein